MPSHHLRRLCLGSDDCVIHSVMFNCVFKTVGSICCSASAWMGIDNHHTSYKKAHYFCLVVLFAVLLYLLQSASLCFANPFSEEKTRWQSLHTCASSWSLMCGGICFVIGVPTVIAVGLCLATSLLSSWKAPPTKCRNSVCMIFPSVFWTKSKK